MAFRWHIKNKRIEGKYLQSKKKILPKEVLEENLELRFKTGSEWSVSLNIGNEVDSRYYHHFNSGLYLE